MSPDIEWQVDSSSGQETIVKTSPPPTPPRWRKIAIAVMICLGVGLGIVYRSIPEPSPRPTSTPLPMSTPIPTPLPPPRVADTIDREARALAGGRMQDFMKMQDATDPTWGRLQTEAFVTWGKSATGPLYTIVETGTLPNDRVWADIVQFHDDQYFRETRFYQLRDHQWVRIAPVADAVFWGPEQTFQTAHFHVTYRAKDESLVAVVVQHWENFYQQVCDDLDCAESKSAPTSRFQMQFQPGAFESNLDEQNNQLNLIFPSPRIAGLSAPDLSASSPRWEQPLEPVVYNKFIYFLARNSTGGLPAWPQEMTSEEFLNAIVRWELIRVTGQPKRSLLFQPAHLTDPALPNLELLWTWSPTYTQHTVALMWTETTALIDFIDEQYGADKVIELLHVLGVAGSLPDAFDRIGLPYPQFKQDWQAWLKQFTVKKN
jgi:hypothetical protein